MCAGGGTGLLPWLPSGLSLTLWALGSAWPRGSQVATLPAAPTRGRQTIARAVGRRGAAPVPSWGSSSGLVPRPGRKSGVMRTPRSTPFRPQRCAELPDNYCCPLLTGDSRQEGLSTLWGGPARGGGPAVSQRRGSWRCPHLVISQGDAGGICLLRGATFCLGQGRLDPTRLKPAPSCPGP